MTLADISKEVAQLEMSEKLLLVEKIWDSIALNNAELPISNQQKQELDQRYVSYQTAKESLEDYQTVHAQLISVF